MYQKTSDLAVGVPVGHHQPPIVAPVSLVPASVAPSERSGGQSSLRGRGGSPRSLSNAVAQRRA
eukprot:6816959-Lingulodinium_polyedra.AAC.1